MPQACSESHLYCRASFTNSIRAKDNLAFLVTERNVNPRLLRHEFRHVHQYEKAGSISAFLPIYLGQIDAPLEADARAHEG